MSWHHNKVYLNIHKGYRCRSLITYWSISKASRKNINNSFSCISVGGIAQLVSVCCLSLIYYTFEWLYFVSESAHGKICINKVTVHRGAYGHPIPSFLSWRRPPSTCMCKYPLCSSALSLSCFAHWEFSNESGWKALCPRYSHSSPLFGHMLWVEWSENPAQRRMKRVKGRGDLKWRDGMLVRNLSNVGDCSSTEENGGGKGETVKPDRKRRERSLLFELCSEQFYLL